MKTEVEELRENIVALQEAVDRLLSSGLRKKTVLLLLKNSTGLPYHIIKQVLKAVETLEEDYFGDD